MPQDYDIVSDFTQDYQRAYMLLNTYYAEAYRDVGYYLGNQWSLEQLKYLNDERRNAFVYNKTRKVIDMVSGYQKANAMASVVVPFENNNEETAEQLTELLRHAMQPCGYKAISRAFHSALCSGVAWVSPWIDYRQDYVNGEIKFHIDSWNDVIWDPFTTRVDLEDCTFVARRKYLSKDVIKSLVPGNEKEIDSMGYGNRDEKFTYESYARQWGLQELLAYNEYWKQRYKKGQLLIDKATGDQRPWKGDKKRLHMLKQMFPNLEVIEGYYKTVEYNIIVENRLLYSGEDPWGIGSYPMVPIFAVHETSYDLFQWKIQSLVRLIRDPQEEYNKRKSKLLDIVDSQIGSGWKAKSGAVSNPKSLFQTGQGKVVFFNPGFELSDAERIDPPAIPESLFALQEQFDKDISELVDVSMLSGGSEQDRMSAALFQMKQKSAVISLGNIFENLEEAQYHISKKVLKIIQQYTPEKVQRIIKQEPTPEFYTQSFLRYDVDIIETVMTPTQRHMNFLQGLALKQAGVNVPDEFFMENSPMPVSKSMKALMEQQAEAQRAQQEEEAQDKKQVNELLQAKAFSDISLGEERLNKIKYDAALSEERLAQAQEDRSRSVLEIVRAGKEFESMDVENVVKVMTMIRDLQKEAREKEADTVIKQPGAKT